VEIRGVAALRGGRHERFELAERVVEAGPVERRPVGPGDQRVVGLRIVEIGPVIAAARKNHHLVEILGAIEAALRDNLRINRRGQEQIGRRRTLELGAVVAAAGIRMDRLEEFRPKNETLARQPAEFRRADEQVVSLRIVKAGFVDAAGTRVGMDFLELPDLEGVPRAGQLDQARRGGQHVIAR